MSVMPRCLGIGRRWVHPSSPLTQGCPELAIKIATGQAAHPWALMDHRGVSRLCIPFITVASGVAPSPGMGQKMKRHFVNRSIRASRETQRGTLATSTMTVGVDTDWAPRKPFINYGLHGVLLFIDTLALFGQFSVLVFPSLFLHP
jgi:hypothetical protein